MLITGEARVNKLIRIASIATSHNQEELGEKVNLLSSRALETLARDVRTDEKTSRTTANAENNNGTLFQNTDMALSVLKYQKGLPQPLVEGESVHVHTRISPFNQDVKLAAHLTGTIKTRLIELVEKGIDVNDLLREFLDKREEELEKEKEELAARENGKAQQLSAGHQPASQQKGMIQPGQSGNRHAAGKKSAPSQPITATTSTSITSTPVTSPKSSRYIPAAIRQNLSKTYGTKCAIRTCANKAQHIHHTQRFALAQAHDPHYLAPLCKEHHQIAHSIDEKYHRKRLRY